MKKDSVYSSTIFVILILCLISLLSLTYASVVSKLTVHGYASVDSARWDVHFEKLSKAELTGTTEEQTTPTIRNDSTSIGDYKVKFLSSNDSVSYYFDVYNGGTMDAVLSAITINRPVCSSSGVNASVDEENVCKNLKYSITYSDGSNLNVGDLLDSKERKKLKLTLQYVGNELPSNVVDISNLGISLIYSQD